MRSFIISILTCVMLTAALCSCAHQQPSRATDARSAERRVFPIYVSGPTYDTRLNGSAVMKHRACTAVYVAPHILATTATMFPHSGDVTSYNISDIIVPDGDYQLNVVDIPYLNRGDGIALVRTEETGKPYRLNGLAYPASGELELIGYDFQNDNEDTTPRAPWLIAAVSPAIEPYAGTGRFARFRLNEIAGRGSCGAALVEADGTLAGIVYQQHGSYSSAISSKAITAILERMAP